MPQLFANAARGTLAVAITAVSTSITIVEDGSMFPVANGGTSLLAPDSTENWFKLVLQSEVGFEIIYCNTHAAGSNTFTNIFRGMEGTLPQGFPTESVVGIRPLAGDMDFLMLNKAAKVHTHTAATTTTPGFMSAADKVKLNAVATGATNDAPILITQGSDLGSYIKPGLYYSHSAELTQTLVGKPTGLDNAFALEVRTIDPTVGTVARYQSIYEYSSVKQWGRAVSFGGSTGWDRVYSEFSPPPVATPTTAGLMTAADKVKLDEGMGNSLFDYQWHNGPRSSIPLGFIPCDGQQLTQLMYPDAYADVMAGKQYSIDEATWQAASLDRSKWSTGGTGWVRVPDLNGVQVGSNKAFYLRGSPAAIGGQGVGDAARKLNFSFSGSHAGAFIDPTGMLSLSVPANYRNSIETTSKQGFNTVSFDSALSTPTADENRPKSAYGVWTVRVFTGVANAAVIDAAQLATQLGVVDAELKTLEGKVGTTILYPGGTSASPASISINQTIEVTNPFPGKSVTCRVEVFYAGEWCTTGWMFSGMGHGVAASLRGSKIYVQSGGTSIAARRHYGGGSINLTSAELTAATPYRVVVTLDGGINA